MGEFIAEQLGALRSRRRRRCARPITTSTARRSQGWCGCTASRPTAFLDYVHDIDLAAVAAIARACAPRSTRCRDGNSSSPTARASMPRRWRRGSACSAASTTSSTSTRSNTSIPSRRARPMSASRGRMRRRPRAAPRCSTTCRIISRPRTTIGMTTVLVHGVTEHPEHQAMRLDRASRRISITAPTRSRPSSPRSALALAKDDDDAAADPLQRPVLP